MLVGWNSVLTRVLSLAAMYFGEGYRDKWIVYGKIDDFQYFTAKELTVEPGQKALVQFGPPLDLNEHWDKPFGKEAGRAIVELGHHRSVGLDILNQRFRERRFGVFYVPCSEHGAVLEAAC